MELKKYLKILLKRWKIIVAAFVVTLIPTILLVIRQPLIYESKVTFVITPRASFAANEEEFVKALDTLSRRVEINTTFAEVADSLLIEQRALTTLDLSSKERSGLKVNGKVKAGTNVLEIVAQGRDPQVVRDFAKAVSVETKEYVSGLYDVFELKALDSAEVPKKPVSPNKPLNIALGGVLGLIMGVSIVFLLEYLADPIQLEGGFNILDFDTGVYNEAYFRLCLKQELSRAVQDPYEFSLALIKLQHRNRVSGSSQPFSAERASAQLTNFIESDLRAEDVLAYFGDSTFGLLLPNRSGKDAQKILENHKINFNYFDPDVLGREAGTIPYSSIGIVTCDDGQATGEDLLIWASVALKEADRDQYSKVVLYRTPKEMYFYSKPDEVIFRHGNGGKPNTEGQISVRSDFER